MGNGEWEVMLRRGRVSITWEKLLVHLAGNPNCTELKDACVFLAAAIKRFSFCMPQLQRIGISENGKCARKRMNFRVCEGESTSQCLVGGGDREEVLISYGQTWPFVVVVRLNAPFIPGLNLRPTAGSWAPTSSCGAVHFLSLVFCVIYFALLRHKFYCDCGP